MTQTPSLFLRVHSRFGRPYFLATFYWICLQVGYYDVMTPGDPETGSFLRLHYPAPAHTKIVDPPLWSDRETRHGLIRFIQVRKLINSSLKPNITFAVHVLELANLGEQFRVPDAGRCQESLLPILVLLCVQCWHEGSRPEADHPSVPQSSSGRSTHLSRLACGGVFTWNGLQQVREHHHVLQQLDECF